ncbi:MAG: AMP-binding protein [Ignavibacteriales bacterium]|nr:AMP-binding protein [Ignavibacteriales bacterium]
MNSKMKTIEIPNIFTVQELFLRSANKFGNKLALKDIKDTPISELTYSELLSKILKFGNALKKVGIKERTHIAIIGDNSVQWTVSFLTCMCFNYVAVPIDKSLSENEILNIIYESDSEVIIFSKNFSQFLFSERSVLKNIKHCICMENVDVFKDFLEMKEIIDESEELPINQLPKIDADKYTEIVYTSGSLGRAKGVMLSQRNLSSNMLDIMRVLFVYPQDRILSILPIHHTFESTAGILYPLSCGASIHFSQSLKTLVEDLQTVKPTIICGVPLLFEKIYKKIINSIKENTVKKILVPVLVKTTNIARGFGLKNLKKIIFSQLHKIFGGKIRAFIVGGASSDPEIAKAYIDFGFNYVIGYGLTETSPILASNSLRKLRHDTTGIPFPSVQIKINNPDKDGRGEIYAKGPNIMLGYYKNEKLTQEAFDGDWFKTGDVASMDKKGYIYISGRKKNVIISKSGKNVFPEEIEDMLNKSEYILESVVYGKKDKKWNEIVAAKIVLNFESFIKLATQKKIELEEKFIHSTIGKEIEKINKQLSKFKRIKFFEIQNNEFEKTTTQKIKRYLVLE